ncbi:hypothetical protein CIW50_08880 [Tardiphaga sp. P9-11]|nr:hypothetical protein CIW50_08880 [Tardiphaga sp. P9-11]
MVPQATLPALPAVAPAALPLPAAPQTNCAAAGTGASAMADRAIDTKSCAAINPLRNARPFSSA